LTKFDKIISVLASLVKIRFSGEINIKIVFHEGGIRRVQKIITEDVDLKEV
jgi:hypothetical protein